MIAVLLAGASMTVVGIAAVAAGDPAKAFIPTAGLWVVHGSNVVLLGAVLFGSTLAPMGGLRHTAESEQAARMALERERVSLVDANRSLHEQTTELRVHRERITGLRNETEVAFQRSIGLLARAAEILSGSDRLGMAADIALNHHEKWDGSCYPHRRREEEIPLAARIVTIADVYDALRSQRPYRNALGHQHAVRVMIGGDDRPDPKRHFDPELLDQFGKLHHAFDEIYRELGSA